MNKSTLHTLNKTALAHTLNKRLSQVIHNNDAVILIEDGVYQCLDLYHEADINSDNMSWPRISKRIYALKDDAIARGIPITLEGYNFISYEEFVKLSFEHNKVISWY